MTHIMLDLETWGRTPGSDIRSIGAIVFDPYTGVVPNAFPYSEHFYVACDNPEIARQAVLGGNDIIAYKYPLTREPATVQWWSEQSEAAQKAFTNPTDLKEALQAFDRWYYSIACAEPMNVRLWANDPHFDVSILGAAFRACDLVEPWHYRAPRSQKTITEAARMTREDYKPFDHGTAHNALDDAISQAQIVCEAYRRLGLQT